jgi:cell division septal protein FtsQ
MFGRRDNRKKRSKIERLKEGAASMRDTVAAVMPYVLLGFVAIGLTLGIFRGYLYLADSPYLEIQSVDVSGVTWADREQLTHRAGLLRGVHIFDVDVDEARRALEANPWVKEARVDRKFPSTVQVEITERTPAALLVDRGYTVIDASGRVIKTLQTDHPDEDLLTLPLLTGLSKREVQQPAGRTQVKKALTAAEYYRKLGLDADRHAISELHLEPVLGLTLVTESGTEIQLGPREWRVRLDRLERVRAKLKERGIEPAYLLLDHRLGPDGRLRRVTVGRAATDRPPSAIGPETDTD